MHLATKSGYEQLFNKLLDIRLLAILITSTLFIDMEISNAVHLFYNEVSSGIGVTVFILISFIYLVSQQCILSYSTNEQAKYGVGKSSFRILRKIINMLVFSVTVCFLTIIFEILIPEYYDTFLLMIVLVASNAIAMISMSDICLKFFSWYRNRKKSTILIFGTMALITLTVAFVTVLFMGMVLMEQPTKVNADFIVSLPIMEQGSLILLLNYVYYYMAISSYIITWAITALLLKEYANKIGKFKYWFVLSLPLIFYLSQLLVTQFGLFIPEESGDNNLNFQMWFLFFYTPSSLVGGILFSIPFFLIIRELSTSNPLKNFLRITAYGLILFFAAGSATVYHTPYPPFGLLTVAAIGPSAYLIAMGLYYSARIISRNRTIEIQMKRSNDYSKFFANIGSAEMEKTMTEIIEGIRKKLPPDEEEGSKEFETVDREIMEYLKKFKANKKSQKQIDND